MSAKQKELRAELRAKREKLTLLQSPFTTLYLFIRVVIDYVIYMIKTLLTSAYTRFVVLPLVLAYVGLRFGMDDPQSEKIVDLIDFCVTYATWWFGLGVLSSIGLGTGMHSGILFLFPHIFRIVSASKACPSMDFDATCDMWWQDCSMECNTPAAEMKGVEASFMQCVMACLIPAMLWGGGTATGEIPPYAISRAAALSGQVDEELEEMMGETKGEDPFSKMKAWMVDFVEKHGFMGILVMSAWPNAAFDLVGICCGQLNVSFWTFYIATFIGKACIKVNGQVVFFVYWFRNPQVVVNAAVSTIRSLPEAIRFMSPEAVKDKMEMALEQVTLGKTTEGEVSWPKFIGEKVIMAAILMFVISCVQQFAQQRQKTIDDAKVEKLGKSE